MLTRSRTSVTASAIDCARRPAAAGAPSPASVSSIEGGAGAVVRYRENAYPPSSPPSATASASASSLEGRARAIRQTGPSWPG